MSLRDVIMRRQPSSALFCVDKIREYEHVLFGTFVL